MKQIKLVLSKETGLNAEIVRIDSDGTTSSHEGGADGILVDLHLRAKPSEQGRLLEMVAASRITLTFEDEEEKNTIPEETRQWMEEVVITPFKHPMAYHGSLGAGLYSEHYLATTPLDVLKARYAKYRREYLGHDPQPTDDEPILPQMQWRSLRPIAKDPDQMLKLYELVANKGITSRDLKLILSTLALNPETVEINSPLIATAESLKAAEESRKMNKEARSEMKEARGSMRGPLTEAVVKHVLKHAQNRGELLIGINPDSTLGRDILKQNVLISELIDEVRLLRREMKGTRQKIDPNL